MSEEKKPYKICITGSIPLAGNVHWNITERLIWDDGEEGLFINFPFSSEVKRRNALKPIKRAIDQNGIDWMQEDSERWTVDLDKLFTQFPELHPFEWLRGVVEPEIEVEIEEREVFDKKRKETNVQFIITRKEIELSMTKKIFLSHKGIDKPIVRDYFNVLKCIGFDPWLDEDAMVAGVPLERALLDGMKKSCAAVFFVTPKYVDDNFLASEINAMSQKREKGDRFSIITLVLEGNDGNKGKVPELLEQYVWKEPLNNLHGLQEIIRALPIEVKQITWK